MSIETTSNIEPGRRSSRTGLPPRSSSTLTSALGFLLIGNVGCVADDGRGAREPSVLVAFDAAARQFPEGVAVDAAGDVYASLAPLGRLVRITAETNRLDTVGAIAGLVEGDLGLLGVTVGPHGDVYGAVASHNRDANGVWRFGSHAEIERVAGTEAIAFPNAVVFEGTTLYVTDTVGPDGKGAVWSVPQGGSAALWAQSDLLAGDGSGGFGIPVGPNGIAVHDRTVFVGLTERAAIAAIPILEGGSPGDVSIAVDLKTRSADGGPIAVDGIAIDAGGTMYVAAPVLHAIYTVSTHGAGVATFATAADGLDAPANVALGNGTAYVSNFSAALGDVSNGKGPAIIRLPR